MCVLYPSESQIVAVLKHVGHANWPMLTKHPFRMSNPCSFKACWTRKLTNADKRSWFACPTCFKTAGIWLYDSFFRNLSILRVQHVLKLLGFDVRIWRTKQIPARHPTVRRAQGDSAPQIFGWPKFGAPWVVSQFARFLFDAILGVVQFGVFLVAYKDCQGTVRGLSVVIPKIAWK